MPDLLPLVRSVAAVLAVGNLLIICHELGHYLAARLAGVQARRFGIGLGPTLARAIDRRGTEWSLSLLPVGGFVSFHGERNASDPYSYAARPPMVRMAIITAGPAANILVAIAVFAIMLATSGEPAFLPVADKITQGSAAEQAGFQPGDVIFAMNDAPIARFEDMRPSLRDGAGRTFHFKVRRDDKVVDLVAELATTQEGGKTIGLLGIRSVSLTHLVLPPGPALVRATEKTWETVTDTIDGITRAVTRGQDTENFAGIVGIAKITGDAAGQGVATLLALVAILSANLALMNLLPIPILDGGALLFCLAELMLRRPLPQRLQDLATGAGFATLATLFMLSTVHDIAGLGLFRWLAQL